MDEIECERCGHMKREGEGCLYCSFWDEKLELQKTDPRYLTIDENMFYVEDEAPRGMFRGYSGRLFFIKSLHKEEVIRTTNLWHLGKIPKKYFLERLPNTHKFVTREEYEKCQNKLSY